MGSLTCVRAIQLPVFASQHHAPPNSHEPAHPRGSAMRAVPRQPLANAEEVFDPTASFRGKSILGPSGRAHNGLNGLAGASIARVRGGWEERS